MDVAQSELDIYVSNEKKERSNLESMKEQLEQATKTHSERCYLRRAVPSMRAV